MFIRDELACNVVEELLDAPDDEEDDDEFAAWLERLETAETILFENYFYNAFLRTCFVYYIYLQLEKMFQLNYKKNVVRLTTK